MRCGDDNAHLSGLGLGASHISFTDRYFTQIMGNSVTAGGIRADSHISIEGNIFFNNSVPFSSTVNILATYVRDSTITHNDIYMAPYSGICQGHGWGSNDAGGSAEYTNRGSYDYMAMEKMHMDLGALYSLSRSHGTLLTENYVYDSGWISIYPDEGSSNMAYSNTLCFSSGN